MDDQQALAIVSALANGANPVTGEIFAANSPYQAPDIIRALFVAQRALESRAQRSVVSHATRSSSTQPVVDDADLDTFADAGRGEKSASSNHRPNASKSTNDRSSSDRSGKANAGKPWSADEDKQLLDEFDAEQPLVHIARVHGRTVNGVRARLEKHGRLPPSEATRWSDRGQVNANSSASNPRSSKQSSSAQAD